MGKTMMIMGVAGLLAGCAAGADVARAPAPEQTVAGYDCALPGTLQRAQSRVDLGIATQADLDLLRQPCKPITVADEQARQEQLASCHLLSGNCAPSTED